MLKKVRIYLLLMSLVSLVLSLKGQDNISRGRDEPEVRIRYLYDNLNKSDTLNAEMIPVNYNLIEDILLALSDYDRFQQQDSLLKLIHDPRDFAIRLHRLDSVYKLFSPVIRQKMAHIEHELYGDAAVSITRQDTSRALLLLEKALQYKPDYHPAWYELIRISLTAVRSEKAMEFYGGAMKRLNPGTDQYYRNLYTQTGPNVLDACILQAEELTRQENFLAAVDYLEKVNDFAVRYNIAGGAEKVARSRANARQGMYNSYLHIAGRAKQARKWQLAADYYKKAADYQQRYPEDIPMTLAFDPGLPQVTDQQDSIREPEKKKTYSKRNKRYSRNKGKTTRKKTEIADSKNANRQGKAAFIKPIAPPAVDSGLIMARAQARESILRSTYDAYFITWKNQLDTARKILMLNQSLQSMHGLQADSSVNAALNELKYRIREKECFNLRSEYETNIRRALNYCKRNDFIAAEYPLQRAAELVNNKKSCPLDDSLYHYCVSTYQPAIVWSKNKLAWESAYLNKDYVTFSDIYEQSYEIFLAEKLDYLGLKQLPLISWLIQQNDPSLLLNTGLQLAERGRHEKGLKMFSAVKDSGIARSLAKDEQQKLGLLLSVSYPDKKARPGWLSIYLQDPWFKFMANSYFRGGKRFSLPFFNR